MNLNEQTCKQAWLSKDPRFDGKFFIGVKTTGIYCRTVCPVKSPQFKNVTFFRTAAQADSQGFRPCLRCRPETSPGTPVWSGTSATVSRALRLITNEQEHCDKLEPLALRLGVSVRHLNRLFIKHLGASPKAVIQSHRLHTAKHLLDETNLNMIQVAQAAGYGSLRRFNDHIKRTYGISPSALRRRSSKRPRLKSNDDYLFRLAYRPPYNWQHMLAFLSHRATPGVECVIGDQYIRTIGTPQHPGLLRVNADSQKNQLILRIQHSQHELLFQHVEKVKSMFDLGADPVVILEQLKKDKSLWSWVKKNPGLRVPGCWNGFEIAVRSITGQQISVTGATTVMGQIVMQYGEKINQDENLSHLFPTPEVLAELDPDSLPMPKARALTIARIARAVADKEVTFDPAQELDQMIDQLIQIKGIGPWTAQYIAMRALAQPDALLEGDLVLEKKAAQLYDKGDRMKTSELLELAQLWRPWRAYASMHIWNIN